MKQLTYAQIEQSKEIQSWLAQFTTSRDGAIEMLLRLRFIPSDDYVLWLKQLLEVKLITPCAVFAVRKSPSSVKCIWDETGEVLKRPAESQGSEDLVQSVLANLKKNHEQDLLDHPSISQLKHERVHSILLIDDSIGSGSRVSGFIKRMLAHKSFLSWWNYGLIKLHVVSMARTIESEKTIVDSLGGSNHHLRRFPVSKKIDFDGLYAYSRDNARERWGAAWRHVYDACRSCETIRGNRRLGFDNTMSNFVFYHSVPNNLPGALWFACDGWNPLFPQRTLPTWIVELLDRRSAERYSSKQTPSTSRTLVPEAINILKGIKSGFRNESRLAWRVGCKRQPATGARACG